MKNSKLLRLLNTFSNKEIRHFRKFIYSPFFNQRKDIIHFFEFLLEYTLEYHIIPEREKLYQKVYPNEEYSDQRMRLLISYCQKHLEHFLIHQSFFLDEVKTKIQLSKVYRNRNLPKLFQESMKGAQAIQKKLPIRNAGYYNNHSQILLEQYHFTSATQRTKAQNLQEISDNIDVAYFTQKLRQICFSLSHQRVYKTEYHFGMLKEMIRYIETQDLLDIPAIAVYYYGYHTLTQPEKIHYYKNLKTILFQYANHFPPLEVRDLFLMTINYCIKRINEGNKEFRKEVLELYEEGLEQKYLMINGILSRFTHRNIITMGLIQKDYEWVEKFIEKYKKHLEKQYQESAYSFNIARLEYARKNYSIVLQLLQKTEYKDLLLNLSAKAIALKTFFDLKEISLLVSHMDAMKKFIRRKKIIGYHQENYLNLIAFTKQLLELTSYDKEARLQLKTKIESTKAVAEKTWLLNQIS